MFFGSKLDLASPYIAQETNEVFAVELVRRRLFNGSIVKKYYLKIPETRQ